MLANTKKELKEYLENNEPEDSASFTYEPILPIIREDNRIQEITSTEDLIFLASQVLDVNEIYHFDLLLGALVKWDRQQEAKQISQWTPILLSNFGGEEEAFATNFPVPLVKVLFAYPYRPVRHLPADIVLTFLSGFPER